MDELVARNLVRWRQDGAPALGLVTSSEAGGRRLTVRLDDGNEHTFAWPSEVLERFLIEPGQHVRVLASDQVGVVTKRQLHNGIALYRVNLPGGSSVVAPEDGLRPAAITDPLERLRAGKLHSARSTNLRVAATRLLYAYQHDELSTLGNSRVELKPHQVGVVHRVANAYPHRFILADEVGLGKTIEAGLIIRELQAREIARRILVLSPSGLVGQWQQELKTKFNLTFSIYTGPSVRWLESEHPNDNVWTVRDTVIASTAYAAWSPERRKEIASAGWDMVIIDEAHHARRTYQGPHKAAPTNIYRLAEELADPEFGRARSMLFLTATPMQLHRFELYSLIELLDPALFPTFEDFSQHTNELRGLNETVERVKRWSALRGSEQEETARAVEHWTGRDHRSAADLAQADGERLVDELQAQHRLSQVMVRNRKRIVGGFMPRAAAIWEVEPTEKECEAYWATTHYLQTGYARSRATKNNALGFLMATFQKLNASSSYALKRSLLRRIEKFEAITEREHREAIVDDGDLEEAPTADALDDLLAERIDADWEEVKELERLVGLLEGIGLDSKTDVLLHNLEQLAADDPDAKVLLFTQFRDTQDYLREHIGPPWNVHLFHGQLKPQEKDAAVAAFRDGTGPRILLSTEAGGEGRNFQYCHTLVNYDLPWNPMRVEQRIGRIDRIGQKHPVKIFNFSTKGTIEERVVEVLNERIGVFQETIGGLDPILGEVESDLRKVFLLAQEEAEHEFRQLEERIENRVQEARAVEERLADLIMDSRSYRKDEVERLLERPRVVQADDIKRFTLGALSEMGVKIDRDPQHAGVYKLEFNPRFEALFPDEVRAGRGRDVTFDLSVALEREEVEFLAFGHPIVEGLVQHVRSDDYDGITSYRVVLTDDFPPTRGWLFVYQLELRGLTGARELLPTFVHEDGRVDDELARSLLERSMSGRREEFGPTPELPPREINFDIAVASAESRVIDRLMERQGEMELTNAERLKAERQKRERFYAYRAKAAADRLAADQRVRDRLRQSPEDDDRKILPVWEKRVEDSERMVASVEEERARRLAELEGREHVVAQHELFAASFVEIAPDPAPLLEQARTALSPPVFREFERVCPPRAARDEVAALLPEVARHKKKLIAFRQRHLFDLMLACAIADALGAALRDVQRFGSSELALLRGAVNYFLLVPDNDNDLTSGNGFRDDAEVANIVLEAIGRPELRVSMTPQACAGRSPLSP